MLRGATRLSKRLSYPILSRREFPFDHLSLQTAPSIHPGFPDSLFSSSDFPSPASLRLLPSSFIALAHTHTRRHAHVSSPRRSVVRHASVPSPTRDESQGTPEDRHAGLGETPCDRGPIHVRRLATSGPLSTEILACPTYFSVLCHLASALTACAIGDARLRLRVACAEIHTHTNTQTERLNITILIIASALVARTFRPHSYVQIPPQPHTMDHVLIEETIDEMT